MMDKDRRSPPLLIVVCTGNVCRSPMAQALFAHHLRAQGLAADVISRGLAAPVGRRPDPHALAVAAAQGVPLDEDKRAAPLTAPELSAATAVFVMETSQRRELLLRHPYAAGKVFLLGQWQQLEIADPIGQPREIFEVAWRAIDAGVRSWTVHLHKAGLVPVRHAAA